MDEVLKLEEIDKETYSGWSVKHFYGQYCNEHEGQPSYPWVKNPLQEKGLVRKGKRKGVHRKRRDRSPPAEDDDPPGWLDARMDLWLQMELSCRNLIITMDDATNEIYSSFF